MEEEIEGVVLGDKCLTQNIDMSQPAIFVNFLIMLSYIFPISWIWYKFTFKIHGKMQLTITVNIYTCKVILEWERGPWSIYDHRLFFHLFTLMRAGPTRVPTLRTCQQLVKVVVGNGKKGPTQSHRPLHKQRLRFVSATPRRSKSNDVMRRRFWRAVYRRVMHDVGAHSCCTAAQTASARGGRLMCYCTSQSKYNKVCLFKK